MCSSMIFPTIFLVTVPYVMDSVRPFELVLTSTRTSIAHMPRHPVPVWTRIPLHMCPDVDGLPRRRPYLPNPLQTPGRPLHPRRRFHLCPSRYLPPRPAQGGEDASRPAYAFSRLLPFGSPLCPSVPEPFSSAPSASSCSARKSLTDLTALSAVSLPIVRSFIIITGAIPQAPRQATLSNANIMSSVFSPSFTPRLRSSS